TADAGPAFAAKSPLATNIRTKNGAALNLITIPLFSRCTLSEKAWQPSASGENRQAVPHDCRRETLVVDRSRRGHNASRMKARAVDDLCAGQRALRRCVAACRFQTTASRRTVSTRGRACGPN